MIKRLLFIWLIISPIFSYSAECHPSVNPTKNQFLIGYGSLISETSKKNTITNVGLNQPVIIRGYSREWNMRALQKKMTFLGVIENPKKSFNGVVFQVNPQSVIAFDQREIGYCRKKVLYHDITFLHAPLKINSEYWIYVPKNECTKPYDKKQFPIANYYQKIFLQGCQDIEKSFGLKGYYQQCLNDMPVEERA